VGLGQAFANGGYDTGYIGKWHIDGQGRSNYIPPERRQGFDYFKVLECTHNYNDSFYYAGNDPTKRKWEGYDAFAQTADACDFIRRRTDKDKPFLLGLSWGPPHDPYMTAPLKYRQMYPIDGIELRPNVPVEWQQTARQWISGYYAHCTALDDCFGELLKVVDDNTIVIFTADHGDMLGSHGQHHKQRPWEESARVPMLIRKAGQKRGGKNAATIDWPDLMPTMLGLAGLPIPDSVEGVDFSDCLDGGPDPSGGTALLNLLQPFGQFIRKEGGCEYRGLRTARYTYVRNLAGPWLLYDNAVDPFQMNNLVNQPAHAGLQRRLDEELNHRLDLRGDRFEHGDAYIQRWGYKTNATGTVPYKN